MLTDLLLRHRIPRSDEEFDARTAVNGKSATSRRNGIAKIDENWVPGAVANAVEKLLPQGTNAFQATHLRVSSNDRLIVSKLLSLENSIGEHLRGLATRWERSDDVRERLTSQLFRDVMEIPMAQTLTK